MSEVQFLIPKTDSAQVETLRAHERALFNGDYSQPSDAMVSVGSIEDLLTFSRPISFDDGKAENFDFPLGEQPNYSQMPTVSYELPEKFQQFSEAIGLIAASEHTHYPWARFESVGVSIDQRPLIAGTAQRDSTPLLEKAAHRDGSRNEWRHIYVVSSNLPTEFFEFESPTRERDIRQYSLPVPPRALAVGEIAMANITTFHRSPRAVVDGERTFLRVSYVYNTSLM